MVIYIKFAEVDEPQQFTTALEAKEHVKAREDQADRVFIAKSDEAVEDLSTLKFEEFPTIAHALEFLGNGEEHPEAKEAGEEKAGEDADSEDKSSDEESKDESEDEDSDESEDEGDSESSEEGEEEKA